jgi:hypothetical protein
MAEHSASQVPTRAPVTVHEVNRLLAVGRLLLSVLTPEELAALQAALDGAPDRGVTGAIRPYLSSPEEVDTARDT